MKNPRPLTFVVFSILLAGLSGDALEATPVVPGLAHASSQTPALRGKVLLTELSCTACHGAEDQLSPKRGPDLTKTSASASYLKEFLSNPQAVHPGSTMPFMLGQVPETDRAEVAENLTHFLQSKKQPGDVEEVEVTEGAADRGKELYHRVGCVACHDPDGESISGSVSLEFVPNKYSIEALVAFLKDPAAVRPAVRMPNSNLSHWEAVDVASFLLGEGSTFKAIGELSEDKIERGREQFVSLNCAQCHSGIVESEREFTAAPLGELQSDSASGCLSQTDGTWPHYAISDSQRLDIVAALNLPKLQSAEEHRAFTLTQYNCIACHTDGGLGGVMDQRDPYFTTDNLNLGEQGRIPPPLAGIGEKLQAKWLQKVLSAGASSRPYMHTRMPAFGSATASRLSEVLSQGEVLPLLTVDRVEAKDDARKAGRELVGVKNLGCVACHTFNGESATTLRGMELISMAERLKENWFHHYMRNPQQFHSSTIMPSFWPGGVSVRPDVLDGAAGQQIDAIWQYLSRGKEARTPEGIRREPILYTTTGDEAIMLRRQYRGIGKRGIGVGYPSKVNLAFDATQMRLGLLWAGEFGEMSGVWRGQGSGNVNQQSRDVYQLPLGPGIAELENAAAPWPYLEKQKRAESLKFRGYSLDAKQRPTFRYALGDLAITDGFIDSGNPPSFERTLRLNRPGSEHLYLLIAADSEMKPGSVQNHFDLSRNWSVIVPEGTLRITASDVTELRVPLQGKQEIKVRYYYNKDSK